MHVTMLFLSSRGLPTIPLIIVIVIVLLVVGLVVVAIRSVASPCLQMRSDFRSSTISMAVDVYEFHLCG